MDLNDKANESGDNAEVVLARDGHGIWSVVDTELKPADDIGTEDFPKFGDFLPVQRTTKAGLIDDEITWLECSQDLAQKLVENDVRPGYPFLVEAVAKDRRGRWQWTVTWPEDSDEDWAVVTEVED